MKFSVEVLLKGRDDVVENTLDYDGPEPQEWSIEDVREVLRLTLSTFNRVQSPDNVEQEIAVRGRSWIVTPGEDGVAIAIEIPSGAVAAGPFRADVSELTNLINRSLSAPTDGASVVH